MEQQGTLVPGAVVRHRTEPDWGEGRVQSVIDGRATVNFEHRGKVVVILSRVALEVLEAPKS